MNKKKIIYYIILAIALISLGRFIYTVNELSPYEYKSEDGFDSRYFWIFKDSIASELKNKFSIGNENDAIYIYEYSSKYNFLVWELRDCSIINIKNIEINPNYIFKKLTPPRTFFSYYNPNIDVEFKTKLLISTIGINLGNGSEILNEVISEKFHMLSGRFKTFGICNKSGNVQAKIDYGTVPVSSDIVFYKARDSFFIIIITPMGKRNTNDETLKLLKLNYY